MVDFPLPCLITRAAILSYIFEFGYLICTYNTVERHLPNPVFRDQCEIIEPVGQVSCPSYGLPFKHQNSWHGQDVPQNMAEQPDPKRGFRAPSVKPLLMSSSRTLSNQALMSMSIYVHLPVYLSITSIYPSLSLSLSLSLYIYIYIVAICVSICEYI